MSALRRGNRREEMNLGIKLIHPGARMPTYASSGAACFDLYAVSDIPHELYQGTSVTVSTGLIFDIPEGYVLMIYSRSGHGFGFDIRLANCVGVIDSDYKEEVMVKLTRDESPGSWLNQFRISHGDRIAQGMLIPSPRINLVQVEDVKANGRGGFGSTGR